MSSPDVGLPSHARESSAASNATDQQRHTRPFSASGELLTVLVHFGRHLDSLVDQKAPEERNGGTRVPVSGGDRLNAYVVASVGLFAASPNLVQCRRDGDNNVEGVANQGHSDGREYYEQTCSPYAATRVVEGVCPTWNEMLAVPLPAGWRECVGSDQPTLSDAANTQHLAMKLELVERGSSHQEDFLLATCLLPLNRIGCHLQQRRFAFTIPSVGTNSMPDQSVPACIFVSLQASPRTSFNTTALEHLEITVESFMPVIVTGNENEEMSLDATSLAVFVIPHVNTTSASAASEALDDLESLFIRLHHGQVLSDPTDKPEPRTNNGLGGLTASSTTATGSASGVYEWLFPLHFTLLKETTADTVEAINISLFVTSSVPNRLLGNGQLELSTTTVQAKDGSPFRQTVIPVTLNGMDSHILGHVALRLRWWSMDAWNTFMAETPRRRVVCTNRKKRSPRSTVSWTGALVRGLNRQPVASFCDAGGVSSVLAELMKETPTVGGQPLVLAHRQQSHQHSHIQVNDSSENSDLSTQLLQDQLGRLQTEGATQRYQIQRLQNELDTRLAAIKSCGLEIVAQRREARLQDEQIQKLKEQVETAQRREQQQLADLLGSAGGNGLTATRPNNQAASQRFTVLTTKYKELDREYKDVKQQLTDAQRSLASYNELETRHAKLQEAHLVQSALVQNLQRDKQQATTLKKAVRMQEKVIRQFEQAVAQQSAKSPTHGPTQPGASDEAHSKAETREALLRVRVQVLEQQLQTNAREAAAEMNALRMRILELESRHFDK